VVTVSLGRETDESRSVTALDALDNALRTVLALSALDEKRAQGRSRITTRMVAGSPVTTLDPSIPFGYAIDRANHRLVLGTAAASVARYLESTSDPKAGDRFKQFQAAAFPGAETFLCVDLDALSKLAGKNRERLSQALAARQKRSTGEIDGDLAHVLALAQVFQAAFITSRFDADATAVHRSVGLIRNHHGGK
jgi:hypothetical protein